MKPVTVKRWISYNDSERYKRSIGGWGGWFNADEKGMRWKDFIDEMEPEDRGYYEAVREAVIKNKIRMTGSGHQSDEQGIPRFSDDTVGVFTFRAWGDMMAAIWSEEEDKDYTYMDFYTGPPVQ